ncbi:MULTISPECIES: exonuclease subunit SbcC [unclassified Tolypothrix]|uniref:exonuclease subunit SbcC n=1 Tax=unclassified Tolypothrix TaxID=2649714 RepID=UPI0005EAC1C0|nr:MULTISPECIES: SMC family ATPase [unclassified Tolypothrix]BAY93524.1 exonuclease SbcC [Microchaete diplosiphon NIES-3275]EKE99404.1 exonuclease SbcC [Tolypothrix sp. PCC 7601]MBE9087244.1 SMC family ATPase [Tolypothrix sp. LEGE 11397]UYD27361.1 SMC family ATPase [Tolypothrix sp. PCC 7712]UYD36776.1 SMC family ATPase [Tolypothrix sp. PCC 7601]
MIPIQLILKNFLSYRDATLDFRGLHTACICGSNGAGKSSLLEAITWAIWGESRAAAEDDVIHTGSKEVRVDFTFQSNQQKYRVIRTRVRSGTSVLEFQIETPNGFSPLTGKGVRATQDLILEHIKLDYDTFINSAYLRQGRADEFMLKRPTERKEILAELLKLNQYDDLEERAKESSRQFKARVEELERSLESIKIQLQQRETTQAQKVELEAELNQLQQVQAFETIQLQSLQVVQHQRQTKVEQLNFVRQQYQNLTQDCDRLQQEQLAVKNQIAELEKILSQEAEIKAGYQQYQTLQSQEEAFANKFAEFTRAQQNRQQKQQQLTKQINEIERQLQQAQAQLEALQQQEREIQQTLTKSGEVEAGLAQLTAARQRVAHFDQLQMQVSPLLQQRATLQSQIDRFHAGLVARLEQLANTENQLQRQQHRQPQLQQAVMDVAIQIEELEKKRVYLQRVQEKGQERRHFIERLQAHQRDYEKLLGELEQKLQMLQTPNALCPLCERPLDEHHWDRVVSKTEEELKDTQGQFWVVREQMAVSDREIQVLRQEYRDIHQQLASYDTLREQRGQLAAQLEATSDVQQQLQQIAAEKQHLERSLQLGDYAPDKQAELQQLDQYLQKLNYNEQDHALARSEVERWRWAEIKQGQIKDATKRQTQLAARKPELEATIAQLQTRIQQEQVNSECAQQIAALDRYITELGYSPEQHNQLRMAVKQNQAWHLRYQQMLSAQQQYPQLLTRSQELAAAKTARLTERQTLASQIDSISEQLAETANPTAQIQTLEQQLQIRRRQLDEQIAKLGRLEQLAVQLESLQIQYEQQQQQLQSTKQQQRVYQELAQAFGKNGIQALMIENVLPQLEAETNQLLSRLSANQLHVQFITQKAGRNGKSTKKNVKLIDTLDILIADARGTRSYETYSGGEAFRINFAIRLALAKLLAQRAGAALQLLIVDEGFGTQDAEGCDRLIAAINAIASDFACILTVTHMPHLKEAFQARIEVDKNQEGSHVRILT